MSDSVSTEVVNVWITTDGTFTLAKHQHFRGRCGVSQWKLALAFTLQKQQLKHRAHKAFAPNAGQSFTQIHTSALGESLALVGRVWSAVLGNWSRTEPTLGHATRWFVYVPAHATRGFGNFSFPLFTLASQWQVASFSQIY